MQSVVAYCLRLLSFRIIFKYFQPIYGGGVKTCPDVQSVLYDIYKAGYWFTYCLVQVFILFSFISLVLNHFNSPKPLQLLIYLLCFIGCIVLNVFIFMYFNAIITTNKFALALSLKHTLNYSAWFYCGVIIRMVFSRLNALMDKRFFFPVILTVFVVSYLFQDRYITVTRNVASLSGILTLISVFYCSRNFWDSDRLLSRLMVTIGTATLPVYLLHYFFIHSVGYIPYVASLNEVVGISYLEVPVIMTCSLVIAILCIMIDNLMKRYLPQVHHFIYQNNKKK